MRPTGGARGRPDLSPTPELVRTGTRASVTLLGLAVSLLLAGLGPVLLAKGLAPALAPVRRPHRSHVAG